MQMTRESKRFAEPPPYLSGTLPSVDQLLQCLAGDVTDGGGPGLFRAASREAYILPPDTPRAHRFGPPDAVREFHGGAPYGLLYAAARMETALWESQFFKHDVTRPGTYYLGPAAVDHGVVGELQFARALHLWNLNGSASSRLGIYDEISSPDHEWCQWLGYRLYQAMLRLAPDARPDGFIYPSRRHRGHTAVALTMAAVEELRPAVRVIVRPFVETPEYAAALADALCVPPPATGA